MDFQTAVIWAHLPALLKALLITGWITICSIGLGTAGGVLIGTLVLVPERAVRWAARLVTEWLLALPALVLIIWLYYSLPLLDRRLAISGSAAAVLGLGLSLAGFVAEIVRSGIQAVPAGQLEVAHCTGMTRLQTVRYILLPQVFRRSWAPIMGQYITCYKMSTLASIVAVGELLHTGGTIIAQTYRPLEIYTAIAILFLITVWPLNTLARRIEVSARLGGTQSL